MQHFSIVTEFPLPEGQCTAIIVGCCTDHEYEEKPGGKSSLTCTAPAVCPTMRWTISRRMYLLVAVYAALLLGIPHAAHAQAVSTGSGQAFPSKPIRIIAPFAPGAGTDTLARTLSAPLSKALGQNVIVENRPGAGTVVGTEVAARSPGDGHTVLIVANSFTINPAVRSKLPYHALKDFSGVARIASTPMVLAVHPSVPVKSVKDLIALAHARPGELTYATSGAGTGHHLAGEMFKSLAKIDMISAVFSRTESAQSLFAYCAPVCRCQFMLGTV